MQSFLSHIRFDQCQSAKTLRPPGPRPTARFTRPARPVWRGWAVRRTLAGRQRPTRRAGRRHMPRDVTHDCAPVPPVVRSRRLQPAPMRARGPAARAELARGPDRGPSELPGALPPANAAVARRGGPEISRAQWCTGASGLRTGGPVKHPRAHGRLLGGGGALRPHTPAPRRPLHPLSCWPAGECAPAPALACMPLFFSFFFLSLFFFFTPFVVLMAPDIFFLVFGFGWLTISGERLGDGGHRGMSILRSPSASFLPSFLPSFLAFRSSSL